jgi:lauroyl/myristoyl acyltransferase
MRVAATVLPLPFALALIDRLGRMYARLAMRIGWPRLEGSRRFALFVESLFDEPVGSERRERLMEDRVALLLAHLLLTHALRWQPPARWRALSRTTEILGVEHLEESLRRGRGAVLITTHFGFHRLIPSFLDSLGVAWVAVGGERFVENTVPAKGDVWVRARTYHRLQIALAQNHVVVLLPDGRMGRRVDVPFLGRRLELTPGAFSLALRAACPLLPIFAVTPTRPPRFRVRIFPALRISARSGDDAWTEAVDEFIGLYAVHLRNYPSHPGGVGRLALLEPHNPTSVNGL